MANSCNGDTANMESSKSMIHQPRMLKDFLQDQNLPFPCKRSTISVFINAAVKRFPFAAVKSPSVLQRTISRRLSRSKRKKKRSWYDVSGEAAVARTTSVTVKDILRWKSFHDLAAEEKVAPAASPSRFTTTTTTTTTTPSAGTPRSSWCESDFTVGDSPVWFRGLSNGFSGDIEVGSKKNFNVNVAAGDRLGEARGASRCPTDELVHDDEEEDQFSPISVLDFTSREDEETFSSFDQTLANMERRKYNLMQRIQEFENLAEAEDRWLANKSFGLNEEEASRIEEKTEQLANLVKTRSSTKEHEANMDYLLMDFFRHELIRSMELGNHNQLIESEILRKAKAWVKGEDDGSLEWDMMFTRDVCIRDMEKRGRWEKCEEERKEIGIEIETMLFNSLLDELSMDLFNLQNSKIEDNVRSFEL